MKDDKKATISAGGAGLGLAEVLTVVFVVLKLVGVINWPWIWVLSPLWISLGLVLLIFLIVFAVIIIAAIVTGGGR